MRTAARVAICVVMTSAASGQETAPPRPVEPDQELLDQLRELQPLHWTYAELAAKADLIVIVKVTSRSEVAWEEEIADGFGEKSTKLIVNHLRVLSLLKGESSDEIDVMTLAWRPDVVVMTSYSFADLRTQLLVPRPTVIIDGVDRWWESSPIKTSTIAPEYLLYLTRLDTGKFVPATGQRYSALSVRTLNN